MEQPPALSTFSELPVTLQIAGVLDWKVIGRPLELLAVKSITLLESFTVVGGVKEIV